MSSFDAVVTVVRGVTRVVLRGELDLASVPVLERELAAIEEAGSAGLELDLRGLTFIDSTGLRAILGADERARRQGRELRVLPGPEPVHRVFRITGLDRRLRFVEAGPGGDPS